MERPILFSTPMVQAILRKQKTQTRRICKTEIAEIPPELRHEGCPNYGFVNEPKCPYGQVGDKLWVRETWMPFGFVNPNHMFIHYKASRDENGGERILELPSNGKHPEATTSWKPSIFMPRWASRITLEITDVRVERLQDISPEDTVAEGVIGMSYQHLWNSINGKKYPWESNPFVWVVSFKEAK